ncbi:amylo-alpha-1,6-glucosidase [Allosphingosinicella vermicomposti]|uniref:amylo-alpha-1,6-glucosidase n=1 Tax=Allosphingosinicella vermicomposti TaxID=614671 RepID=UPI000D0E679C|nr:amylo-alpha-1,6-glucosidase [Allosphingosinicella vermicomposti]
MADEGRARAYPAQAVEVQPEEYYIEAEQSLVERPLRTLKRDNLFGVFDIDGDFGAGKGPEGLYFRDTRFLSRFDLTLNGDRPLLLDSVVLEDNAALLVDLTNNDIHDADGRVRVTRGTIFANRWKFLIGQHCYERIGLRNFGTVSETARIDLAFGADFVDLFEVRGEKRKLRGVGRAEIISPSELLFTYRGLDDIVRYTTIAFDPPPHRLSENGAGWDLELEPDGRVGITITITCAIEGEAVAPPLPFLNAYRDLRRLIPSERKLLGGMSSSNPLFDEVLRRAAYDLDMLITATPHGPYPYAGVPWYSTVFGRDGILSALFIVSQAPEVAQGVLRTLAASQATQVDERADAQPGKILHESRAGEMAELGEVPFRRYYGTVDATPLFIMLADAYFARTGDTATIREIWPNIEAAMHWIDVYGDADGDGFVEYCRMTDQGLSNQGWKDSHDAIFHADGTLAEGPIALCEVQAYVFAAKRGAANLARALGSEEQALRWEEEADRIRLLFEEKFWLEDLQIYALALDGKKQPCRVRTSNAGHALFTGIASPERAAAMAEQFVDRTFFSGWGVRTVATGEARYNPMSYHNGSVWPHDNAVIALGLARYGYRKEAAKIFEGLFAAATFDELRRLPELFCGFRRRPRRGPTAYPVACAPQAWAAAAPFALLVACLGLEIDEAEECVRLNAPILPRFIDTLHVPELRVGKSRLALRFNRHDTDVTVAVPDRSGPATVMIVK